MAPRIGWVALALFTLVAAGVLGWQRWLNQQQRGEIELLRAEGNELARLQAENRRLKGSQLPAEARDALLAKQAELAKTRAEIEQLQQQVGLREREAAENTSPPAPPRFGAGVAMPAADWRNMGSATPEAVLETALWAAAGGDVDAFAKLIVLDEKARAAATELLGSLPPELREQLRTPERMIAFFSIKDVPTGQAKVRSWSAGSEKFRPVELALLGPDGRGREVRLMVVRSDVREDWKLGVTSGVVAKYAAALKAPVAASASVR